MTDMALPAGPDGGATPGPDEGRVVEIASSSDGASGVLFFNTAAGRTLVVVKSSATNVPEYFGTLVARVLRFPSPPYVDFAHVRHPVHGGSVVCREAVPAVPAGLPPREAQGLGPAGPGGHAGHALRPGREACLDLLLNNQDRLPVAWENDGNARNIMVAPLAEEAALEWQGALLAGLRAPPGESKEGDEAVRGELDRALLAGLGGVVPIDQAFMCPAVVNALSTSLRAKYLANVRCVLASVGPWCPGRESGPLGEEDVFNAAVVGACEGDPGSGGGGDCSVPLPDPCPLAKLVPFLANEGLGDIGPLGLAFVVVGVRQGIADVAAMSPTLLASVVEAVGGAIPPDADWEGLWAADTHALHAAFMEDVLGEVVTAAGALASARLLPRALPLAELRTVVAEAAGVHAVATRAIGSLTPLTPSRGPSPGVAKPPVGRAPAAPRVGTAPAPPASAARAGVPAPVSLADLLAGSRRLKHHEE